MGQVSELVLLFFSPPPLLLLSLLPAADGFSDLLTTSTN